MTWTPKVFDTQAGVDRYLVRVRWSNDTDKNTLDETYQITNVADCAAVIESRRTQLNTFDPSAIVQIPLGDPPTVAPSPAPEAPSQDQLNQDAYFQNLDQLRRAKEAADLIEWAKASSDPDVQSVLQTLTPLISAAPTPAAVQPETSTAEQPQTTTTQQAVK